MAGKVQSAAAAPYKVSSLTYFSIGLVAATAGILYVTDWGKYASSYLYFILIVILSAAATIRNNISLSGMSILIMFSVMLFFIMGTISGGLHGNVDLILGATYLLTLISLCFILSDISANQFYSLYIGFLIPNILFVFGSILIEWPSFGISYMGLAYNPNAMGGIIATTLCLIFSYAWSSYLKGKIIWKIIFIIPFLFVILLFTRSRASILCFLALLFISLTCGAKTLLRNRGYASLFMIVIFIGIVLLIFWNLIVYGLVEKTFRKLEAGDITDGRLDVWINVVNSAELFGSGRDAFSDSIGAHNTYISILAQYGIVALFSFMFVNIFIFFRAYSFMWRNIRISSFSFVPLSSVFAFIMLSLFEGMMMKTTMLAMFLFCGAIPRNSSK